MTAQQLIQEVAVFKVAASNAMNSEYRLTA